MIRDVDCGPSESEIDRSLLVSERAGYCVLTISLVYCRGKESEETGEEGSWEVTPGRAGVREDGLVDGGCCDR